MNPILTALTECNRAFESPRLETPGLGPEELAELRIRLLEEEVREYAEAVRAGDLVEILDALGDIAYILAGTVLNHGMQDVFDDAFDEIHASNMAKLVDGKVLRREDGKVMKGPNYFRPDIAGVLERSGALHQTAGQ